jgi:hypothetical protein
MRSAKAIQWRRWRSTTGIATAARKELTKEAPERVGITCNDDAGWLHRLKFTGDFAEVGCRPVWPASFAIRLPCVEMPFCHGV